MTTASNYEKEFLAIRHAVMCQSYDPRVRAEGYKKLIDMCKKLKWVL
jgi:hypothetical protein